MEKAFLRVGEVANVIGLGRSLTYRLIAEGKIPSLKLAGTNSLRVSAKVLQEWIEREEAVGKAEDRPGV